MVLSGRLRCDWSPADPAASPLTIVFDGFPGLLIVPMGRGDRMHLPVCGSDAFGETVEECIGRLREQVGGADRGRFGERLVREHGWWQERRHRTAGQGVLQVVVWCVSLTEQISQGPSMYTFPSKSSRL